MIQLTDRINIRVGPKIHKEIKLLAVKKETSINEIVKTALEEYLERNKK